MGASPTSSELLQIWKISRSDRACEGDYGGGGSGDEGESREHPDSALADLTQSPGLRLPCPARKSLSGARLARDVDWTSLVVREERFESLLVDSMFIKKFLNLQPKRVLKQD